MPFKLSRESLDHYLYLVAKEYKGKAKKVTTAELVLVGGAAIIINYSFRGQTTDIDAMILAASHIRDAISHVADDNGLDRDWLNDDFKKTSSYSDKLALYSKPYKTFCGCVNVRVVDGACLIAMKVRSFRQYKHDISDIVGVLKEHEESGKVIELDRVLKIYKDLYNQDMDADKLDVVKDIFASESFEELYYKTVREEANNKEILIEAQDEYKGVLNKNNASDFLASLKKKAGKQ